MNTTEPPYGLPTFPIFHDMTVGMRPWPEVEWLLDHGEIHSEFYQYYGIRKTPEGIYQYYWCEDGIEDLSIEIEAESDNLETLVLSQHLGIGDWIWIGKREYDT